MAALVVVVVRHSEKHSTRSLRWVCWRLRCPERTLCASLLLLLVLLPRCTSAAAPLDDTVSFSLGAGTTSDSVPFMEGWRVTSGRAEDWADAIAVVQKRLRVSAGYRASFATPSNLNMLVSLARKGRGSESEEAQASAAGALMTLTERCSGCLFSVAAYLVTSNAIPVLVSVAQHGSEKGRANAAGTLRNMARPRVDAHLESIVSAGAIPVLVSLAWSGSDEGKTRAVLCLESLATIDANRKAIVTAGAIPVLTSLARHGSVEGKEAATKVLSLVSASVAFQALLEVKEAAEAHLLDTEAATGANNLATNTNDKLIIPLQAKQWPDLQMMFAFLILFAPLGEHIRQAIVTLTTIYGKLKVKWRRGGLGGLLGAKMNYKLALRLALAAGTSKFAGIIVRCCKFVYNLGVVYDSVDVYLAAFDWMVVAISVYLLDHLVDAVEDTAWVEGPLRQRYDAINTTASILIFVFLLPFAAA